MVCLPHILIMAVAGLYNMYCGLSGGNNENPEPEWHARISNFFRCRDAGSHKSSCNVSGVSYGKYDENYA